MEEYVFHKQFCWQHNEIHLDMRKERIELRNGEYILDRVNNIEDSKGNSGEGGSFLFTNLRLVWFLNKNYQVNISIGYDTVLSVQEDEESNKVVGKRKTFSLSCKKNENRYEFMFASYDSNAPNLTDIFNSAMKNFDESRLYRDVKLKGNFIVNQQLSLLKGEKVYHKTGEVHNLSYSKSTVGLMILTNVRFIWFSDINETLNLSIPLSQIKEVKVTDCLVLAVGKGANTTNQKFKFATDEENNVGRVIDAIKALDKQTILDAQQGEEDKVFGNMQIEESSEVEENAYPGGNIALYLVNGNERKNTATEIEFNLSLGLAIEKLPEGKTIENYWKVI